MRFYSAILPERQRMNWHTAESTGRRPNRLYIDTG